MRKISSPLSSLVPFRNILSLGVLTYYWAVGREREGGENYQDQRTVDVGSLLRLCTVTRND